MWKTNNYCIFPLTFDRYEKQIAQLRLNASVLLCLRDVRFTNLSDSTPGIIESSLFNGSIHFDCYSESSLFNGSIHFDCYSDFTVEP
jgi:hypothetical protein